MLEIGYRLTRHKETRSKGIREGIWREERQKTRGKGIRGNVLKGRAKG